MEWQLEHLFKSVEEAEKKLFELKKRGEEFKSRYRETLERVTPEEFGKIIEEYEAILEEIGRAEVYAFLLFTLDSSKGRVITLFEELGNRVRNNLIWFELEFGKLPKSVQQKFIDQNPKYRYLLKQWIEEYPHRLSEGEERVLMIKNSTGREAFIRLFDEEIAKIEVEWDGQKIGEEELLAKLHSPERKIRLRAQELFTDELKKRLSLLTYIYNQLKRDWNTTYIQLRNYSTPEQVRHLSNQVSQRSVDALIEAVENSTHLVEEYYQLKGKLLGLKPLYDYDRYAPLNLSPSAENIPIEVAQQEVVESYRNFDPLFGEIVETAFREGWIDLYPKPGKRSGAFSCATTTDLHPYVLLNYTGNLRDVFTIAHELGHAIHQYLSRGVGYLQSYTPLTTAETASIFGEMLLFDRWKNRKEGMEKVELIGGKLEEIFATIHRQVVFTNFERRVYNSKEELTPEQLSQIWMEENRKMFGDSLQLTDNYRFWWSYITHFYHSPFYCYAYAYAGLLVFTLYHLYRNGYPDFKSHYIRFLQEGGAVPPIKQFKRFGLDLESVYFWQEGLKQVEELLEEFKKEVKKLEGIQSEKQ